MPKTQLTAAEHAYYARHISLAEIGEAGQEKLKASSVLLIGLGGLGSPLAMYLTAAGVGRLGILEFDQVETSNLHRQVLYGESMVGEKKLEAGIKKLRDLNPHVQIDAYPYRIDAGNARALIKDYDVVADGADNFPTRYLVNDACVLEKKPLVSASILAFEGQLSVFNFQGGPCYRCLYPQMPPADMAPSCSEAGVLGVLPGVMGTLQATEVLKVILGIGQCANGRLLCYDALALTFNTLRITRNPECPVCGEHPTIQEVAPNVDSCATVGSITAGELRDNMQSFPDKYQIIDVREAAERAKSRIEPSLHIPLPQILSGQAQKLSHDRTLVIHCASGVRSAQATKYLLEHGFKDVLNLVGGISAWQDLINRGFMK